MSYGRTAALVVIALSFTASAALAQPLGTFRWQIQPYCNILRVNVVQQAGIYTLDGTDDRCGATQPGSVVGIAFVNLDGSVGFGITTVLPGGTPVHLDATINIASLNGTWRDSAGNTGSFIFTPATGTGGVPRPVPSGGLAAASVTAIQIAPAAVGATQLAADSVSGSNILNGSITAADLAAAPRAAFASADQTEDLTTSTTTLVRSVTLAAPAAGTILVNASAYLQFTGAATDDLVQCSITTGTGIDTSHLTIASEGTSADDNYAPYAATRGFSVTAGSSTTVNLVCSTFTGTATLRDSSLTALFVATP